MILSKRDIPHLLEHKIHLVLSLSLLSASSTPADPNPPLPPQLEPLAGLTHHHRYYPSLCNDVMVFDPGRGLGEGRNKEKGL